MPGLIRYIARRLLFTWVRTSVLPRPLSGLGIDPGQPLVYVMEARSASNLLVLEQECRRAGLPSPVARLAPPLRRCKAVYCVAARPSLRFWRAPRPRRSRMLGRLLEALQADPALDVQLVPVSIFWGRAPARERSWLKVLFADTWSVAGRTRKLLTILLHGRQTLVSFAEPMSLRALAAAGTDLAAARDTVQVRLSDFMDAQRAATLGPDMSHRRTLLNALLCSPAVQQAISEERERGALTQDAATQRARRYLFEIAANSTGVAIQLLFRALSAFWNRFYDGIEVQHAEELPVLAREHALVYVPCHRSHVDYLLLSYVIYTRGLAIPSIAAGRNLDLPLLGRVLRRGGAFFIRRSFRDNKLYGAVLFEYLATLVARGAPVEYFIEGTRSRTGRLLPARAGMLAMTVRGYLRERGKPVVFVPVYIGYEKLIEGRSYLGELKGKSKQRETLFGALRSILALRGHFGKVSLSFGEPVALEPLLDAQVRSWRDAASDAARPPWLHDLVGKLGREVLARINCAAVVNPVNLVSLVVLSTPRQAIGETELCAQLDVCLTLLREAPYAARVTLPERRGAALVVRAEARTGLRRRGHPLGDILYFGPAEAVLMTYYRNNVLHLLALPSIIACCFNARRELSEERLLELVSLVYPFVRTELFLHWPEDAVAAPVGEILRQFEALGLVARDRHTQSLRRPGPRSAQAQQLALLARVIQPLLERYFMIISVLQQHAGTTLERRVLEERCILLAQRLAILHELETPDFFDRGLFENFVDGLIARGYVEVDTEGCLAWTGALVEADEEVRLLLGNDVRQSIVELTRHRVAAAI